MIGQPLSTALAAIPRCIVHPEAEATRSLNVPCAPDGKCYICETCAQGDEDETLARVFDAYRAGHGKRIKAFKQVNPNS